MSEEQKQEERETFKLLNMIKVNTVTDSVAR